MLAGALILLALAQGTPPDMAPATSGTLEGRPTQADASALQSQIDRAAVGSTLEIGPGTYRGDLVIDRPLRLIGRSGRGSSDQGTAVSCASGPTTS
jgi:nitrous oxidase accessory protein